MHVTNRLAKEISSGRTPISSMSLEELKQHILLTVEFNWEDIATTFHLKQDLKFM